MKKTPSSTSEREFVAKDRFTQPVTGSAIKNTAFVSQIQVKRHRNRSTRKNRVCGIPRIRAKKLVLIPRPLNAIVRPDTRDSKTVSTGNCPVCKKVLPWSFRADARIRRAAPIDAKLMTTRWSSPLTKKDSPLATTSISMANPSLENMIRPESFQRFGFSKHRSTSRLRICKLPPRGVEQTPRADQNHR